MHMHLHRLYIEKQATKEDRTEDIPFLSWTLQYEKEMGKWSLSLWGHTMKRT